MINNLCAVLDTIRKVVGGFKQEEMIAVGVVCALALVLGFFIGAVSLYAVGVKKGKRKGERNGYMLAKKQMKEMGVDVAEEKPTATPIAGQNAEVAPEETEEVAAEKVEPEVYRAEKKVVKKEEISKFDKDEILRFASTQDEFLEANLIGGTADGFPDCVSVGECPFMFVYENNGALKILLRLHEKTAKSLSNKVENFEKAACPSGADWFSWIITADTYDEPRLTKAIKFAYQYTFVTEYDENTCELKDEEKSASETRAIKEEIFISQDEVDAKFLAISTAQKGAKHEK